ncbi:hypothetical protein LG299_00630 [Microbacterium lacus]|uniref:hypothetical protein n=1 Tax=Microbacterium lacus TaxID=415217 RepID=UPI00384E54D9
MTDENQNEYPNQGADPFASRIDNAGATAGDTVTDTSADTAAEKPQYGVGPFSIREVALTGLWLVAFIVSFFSVNNLRFESVWTSGLLWVLTIGVPTAAVFLIVLRRLSPEGIRRVGSLGIDQFASVAFVVSSVVWLQLVWETVAVVAQDGPWLRSWVIWVELFLMLAGVFLTAFAPFIAPFDEDFRGRREIPAHRNARPIRAVTPRPAPTPRAEPETGEAAPATSASPYATATQEWTSPVEEDRVTSPVEDEPAPRQQAFWALAPEERDVVDENGTTLFQVGPTAWALVIEDRGESFVIRHEDGTIGYLNDVEGVTRG